MSEPKIGSDAWKAREHERRIQSHMNRCAFFTGVQHDICDAGVRYDDVRREGRKIPCLAWDDPGGTVCEKRRWPTREEAEAEVAAANASFERVNTCLKSIRSKHGKARGLRDSMPCPIGCGGTLHYSIAGYNGHVHGQCSTEGCVSWMQ
jgi:hypothetical protein